jgi:hypothetical protein
MILNKASVCWHGQDMSETREVSGTEDAARFVTLKRVGKPTFCTIPVDPFSQPMSVRHWSPTCLRDTATRGDVRASNGYNEPSRTASSHWEQPFSTCRGRFLNDTGRVDDAEKLQPARNLYVTTIPRSDLARVTPMIVAHRGASVAWTPQLGN